MTGNVNFDVRASGLALSTGLPLDFSTALSKFARFSVFYDLQLQNRDGASIAQGLLSI